MATDRSAEALPPRTPGLLFGLGLGGFVDGIVLHQILQWHHMVSARTPPITLAGLEINTVADGFFHVGTWLLVLAASITTITAWRQGCPAPSWAFHFGLVLARWGIFSGVEGVAEHQILGGQHVRGEPGATLRWDLGFLAFGVLYVRCGRGARLRWELGFLAYGWFLVVVG